MSKSKGFRVQPLSNRTETKEINSNDIMSCSFPGIIHGKIAKKIINNKENKIPDTPHTKSAFFRKTTTKMVEVMKKLMDIYPEIFRKEEGISNKAKCTTMSYGAKNINELNEMLSECSLFYNRSEAVRMGVLIYHLIESIGADLTAKKEVPDDDYIEYIKIDGRVRRILNIDGVIPNQV